MKEEDEVRVGWKSGKLEEGKIVCETCGDKSVWGRPHACCSQQCDGILNALQVVGGSSKGYRPFCTGLIGTVLCLLVLSIFALA